jgi:hypothetical protein
MKKFITDISYNKIKNKIENFHKHFLEFTPEEYSSEWIGPGNNKIFLGSLDRRTLIPAEKKEIEYYDQNGYYITDSVGDIKSINKNPNFTYKINRHGFRSKHFEPVDQNKTTILTAGCSHSFGQGLPEELRWQSFLLKNLNTKNIELFDVSSMGASYRLIVRNIIAFIRNYGKPNYIFVVFPDVARDFLYDKDLKKFWNVSAQAKFLTEENKKKPVFEYTLSFNEYDATMKAIEAIWYLEEICKWAGIKLFWTTWFSNCSDNFKNYNFNNFVEQDWKYFNNVAKSSNPDNVPYWRIANDGSHMGSYWTSWQGKFFSGFVSNE